MVIRTRCPSCGRALRFPEEALGKTGRCCDEECQAKFVITSAEAGLRGPHRPGASGLQSPSRSRIRIIEHVAVPSVMQAPGTLLLDFYEVYEAGSEVQAKEFLTDVEVKQPRYYVVVETPEGIFGRDSHGGYEPSRTWRGNLHDWNRNKIPITRIITRLSAASEAVELGRFAEAAAVLRPVARLPMIGQFVQTVLEGARGTISPEELEALPELMRAYASQYAGR